MSSKLGPSIIDKYGEKRADGTIWLNGRMVVDKQGKPVSRAEFERAGGTYERPAGMVYTGGPTEENWNAMMRGLHPIIDRRGLSAAAYAPLDLYGNRTTYSVVSPGPGKCMIL